MSLLKTLKFVIFTLVFAFMLPAVSVLAANYASPTTQPPICPDGVAGCDSPIHTGVAAQTKRGPLSINQLLSVFNNALGGVASLFFSNNALTNSPTGVVGELKFRDNTGGVNAAADIKVTKNAVGFTDHSIKFTTSGNAEGLTLRGTRVGVGTSSPSNPFSVQGNSLFAGSVGITNTVNPRYLRFLGESGDSSIETSVSVPNGIMYYRSSDNKFRCKQAGAWVDCVGGGTGTGGDFWEVDPLLSGGIKNKTTGTVRVGTYNPSNNSGYGAVFGRENGIEAYTLGTSGKGAVSAYGRGVGAMGLVAQTEGNTTQLQNYGAKVLSSDVGTLSRGNTIGIYATNKGGIADVTRGTADGDTAKVDAGTFAGYFDGPVRMYSSNKSSGATIGGDNGNGLEAYVLGANGVDQQNTTAAINTAHSGNFGIGFVGHAYGGGTTYGSKSIAGAVGAFNRGKIGAYITNQGGVPGSDVDAGWYTPSNVLNGPSYAAVINGPTWIADTVSGSALENPDTSKATSQLTGAGVVIARPDASGAASGLEAYTSYAGKGAISAFSSGVSGVGLVSQAVGASSYGALSIGNIGLLARGSVDNGSIGLYATNRNGISYLTTDSSKVKGDTALIPNASYAGYFDGPVAVYGSAGITGNLSAFNHFAGPIGDGYGAGYFFKKIVGGLPVNDYSYGLWQPAGQRDRVVLRSGGTSLEVVDNGVVEVSNTIKIKGGSPGVNKVLTSDADGDASWKSLNGGSGNLRIVPDMNNSVEVEVSGPNGCKGQETCSIMCPAGMVVTGFPEFDDKDDSHVRHMMCSPLIIQAAP